MTNIDDRLRRERELTREEDLQEVLALLLDRAISPRFWLLLLDDRQRLLDPLMPIDDYPDCPDEVEDVPDLGPVSAAELLAQRFGTLRELLGAESAVLVWERVAAPTDADRRWPQALAAELSDAGVRVRAQFVLDAHGVAPLELGE